VNFTVLPFILPCHYERSLRYTLTCLQVNLIKAPESFQALLTGKSITTLVDYENIRSTISAIINFHLKWLSSSAVEKWPFKKVSRKKQRNPGSAAAGRASLTWGEAGLAVQLGNEPAARMLDGSLRRCFQKEAFSRAFSLFLI